MRVMSNLEYVATVRELQPLLGKRFGRLRRLAGGFYRLKIGDAEIIIEPGVRLHKTKYVEETESPDQLVQKANAELENARLVSIKQVNNDRIIEFGFEHGTIYFEMFGKGNCIFVQEGKTAAAMKEESWADREIRKGREYKPPKSNISPSFQDALSDKYVIIALLKLPLGKEYALELLQRCAIPEKTPGIQLTGKQMECIGDELSSIQCSQNPHVFYENGKPIDFGLLHFSRYKDTETKDFGSMNEALDEYYWLSERKTENPELLKLERRLEEQERRMAELEKGEQEMKMLGDYLLEHFDEAEKILQLAKKVKPDELEKKLEKLNGKIDKKEKSLEINLQ